MPFIRKAPLSNKSGYKFCTLCKLEKDISEYHSDTNKKDGRCSRCKQCMIDVRKEKRKNQDYVIKDRERSKQFRINNPDLAKFYVTNANLKKKYGITLEEYKQLSQQQNNLCAICGQQCVTGYRLAVDHCHTSGKVRGLLCQGCNVTLGKMKDSPELLRKAAEYLENRRS